MQITTLGIDLAKNVFHLHGVDARGREVLRKRLSRNKLLAFITNLPPCLIGLEACGGAHHWARAFAKLGHEVRLMSPQFVKSYVKSNKNDYQDAEAICEAVARPTMRFVPIKSLAQQDLQALHRIRARLIKQRTALVNQARGLLSEYGIVLPQHVSAVRRALPALLEDADNELSDPARALFAELAEELRELDSKIAAYDGKLAQVFARDARCRRLGQIKGIGPLTATALSAAVGDARVFRNGRELAAYLGLVPRQHSTGGKARLLGISKRGDPYLRTLLIHGARATLRHLARKDTARARWLKALKARRGMNIAAVALANKNARAAWALLRPCEHPRRAPEPIDPAQ